jgi:cell division protein FtsI/penicillin-binding protein 2
VAAATSQERILRLGAVFAAGCALLVGRLFQLQVIEGERWTRESESLRVRRGSIPYRRGAILDRAGVVLAEDRGAYDLQFRYRAFRRGNPLAQAAHLLGTLSGRTVGLSEVAGDPGRFASALSRVGPRHLLGRPSLERKDAAFYLGRLLAEARPRDPAEGSAPGSPLAREREADALSRRILEETATGGEAAPFAERVGAGTAALEALLRSALGDLDALERACALPSGRLLEEADRRRAEIEAEVEERATERRGIAAVRRDHEERAVRIETPLPFEGALRLALAPDRFPGFAPEATTRRALHPDAPVPLLGLVGRPTREEIEREARLGEEYRTLARTFERSEPEERRLRELEGRVGEFEAGADDPRGKGFGIEYLLDGALRGRRGSRVVSTEGASATTVLDEPPVDGRAVALTIDLELERAALQALREGYVGISDVFGAVVLLEPGSGNVLALVSNPSYSEGEYRGAFEALKDDPRFPLHPRAYDPYYPPAPGSVFKVVVAAAALEEGLIEPGSRFTCAGIEGRLRCNAASGHGTIDLGEAIEKSCNVAFYKIGERLGSERLARWARAFGFGEKTGIEVREIAGTVRGDLTDGDSARRFAIGQTLIDASPLQVARMMAAFANGGRLVRPRLVARVGDAERTPAEAPSLPISPSTLHFLREAMGRVVRTGTARPDGGFDLGALGAVGKTGTAEVGKDIPDHSWFAGYAPAEAPRVVVAVYCERSGRHGGDLAAPIAERVLRAARERGLLGGVPEEPR